MESVNVLVTEPFPAALIEKLENVSPRIIVVQHAVEDANQLGDAIEAADVLYTSAALPEPGEAPRLRWVQLHYAGVDHILRHPLFTGSDVTFTTASGIHSVNMAEYVLAQVLAFSHHLERMWEDKRDRVWTDERWNRYTPRELRGATLGVVGYGSIGREVARLAQAFGMAVLAVKHDLRNLANDHTYCLPGTGDQEAEIPDRIYPVEALHSFLKECDYVVLTVPLTDATRHLIDADALSAMKPSAFLINVARGQVVDEAALTAALKQGRIAGAALDVFEEEPLPSDSPLWELPNVVISPHISGFTPHYDERATDLFAENLRRFITGEPLLNVVNRSSGY